MPEEQIDSNINQGQIKQPSHEFSPAQKEDFAEKQEIPSIPQENIEQRLSQEIQAPSFNQGGLEEISQSKQQQIKRIKEIESVMEKNIVDIYVKMPVKLQKKFKIKGEKIAIKINKILTKTKINFKKIMKLIRKWLSIIPGCNKFFLEQSSKIKTDEIIKLKQNW